MLLFACPVEISALPPLSRHVTAIARQAHQSPPASSMAFSNARLAGVRRLPALRGSTGSPAAARRRASSGANAAMSTTRSSSSFALDVFNAMVAARLFPDTPLKIGAIEIGKKGEQGGLEPVDLGVIARVTVIETVKMA